VNLWTFQQATWLPQTMHLSALLLYTVMKMLTFIWLFIRNFRSISTCCCNREPTQALKWFVACVLIDICSDECPADKVSWCCWLDSGKFLKYPFQVAGFFISHYFNRHPYVPTMCMLYTLYMVMRLSFGEFDAKYLKPIDWHCFTCCLIMIIFVVRILIYLVTMHLFEGSHGCLLETRLLTIVLRRK